MAVVEDIVLAEIDRLARGDTQLPLDEVESRDPFGDRVLNLEPSVHLQEEELAVLVEEFDGAGVDVATRLRDPHGRLTHRAADLVGKIRCRRFLNELLMAALGRAVALSEPQSVAVSIGEDLHLDVPRPGEVPLHVALAASEVVERLALGALECGLGFFGGFDDFHAASAAAVGRLNGDGPAEFVAEVHHFLVARQGLAATGHAWDTGLLGREARGNLVAHDLNRRGRWTDEGHAHFGDGAREIGVLREEAVSRVY